MSESILHMPLGHFRKAGSTSCPWTNILVLRNCKLKRLNFNFQTFKYFFVICVLHICKLCGFLKKGPTVKKHWSIVILTNSKNYLNVFRIKLYLSNLLFCIKNVSLHQLKHMSVHIIAVCHLLIHPKWSFLLKYIALQY